jgi:hypothetical protein
VLLPALVLLALVGCSSQQERPEGIVERWLLALNQGSAGQPGRYAPARVSDTVLPGWEELDPGELDSIEVAHGGAATVACPRRGYVVPFRVVRLDDSELRAVACVSDSRITQLADRVGFTGPVFRSEGGPSIAENGVAVWLIAAGIGLAILLGAELLMRFVRASASD